MLCPVSGTTEECLSVSAPLILLFVTLALDLNYGDRFHFGTVFHSTVTFSILTKVGGRERGENFNTLYLAV